MTWTRFSSFETFYFFSSSSRIYSLIRLGPFIYPDVYFSSFLYIYFISICICEQRWRYTKRIGLHRRVFLLFFVFIMTQILSFMRVGSLIYSRHLFPHFLCYSSFIYSFFSSLFLIYFLFPFFVIPIYLHSRTFATLKK